MHRGLRVNHGYRQGEPGDANHAGRGALSVLKRAATAIVATVASVAMLAAPAYAAPQGGKDGKDGAAAASVSAKDVRKSGSVAPAAAGDTDVVADTSTIADWQKHLENSTENIGRIWTDKSVSTSDVMLPNKDGGVTVGKDQNGSKSSFLVGLSALSSVSNLTKTSSQPLDIVLALDVSGSMDDPLTGSSYTRVYASNLDHSKTYYISGRWGYQEVRWNSRYNSWGYSSWGGWTSVTPRTSSSDWNNTQFYEYVEGSSKMQALKNAVDSFIRATAEQSGAVQNRIALVKYSGEKSNSIGNDTYRSGGNTYNYTQVVSDFSDDFNDLENRVDELRPAGSTAADYGLEMVQRVFAGPGNLQGARDGAKKIVIMFTDGEPNHQNGFDNEVAADTVNIAHSLKRDNQALVYTVGVFAKADPGDTTRNDFNKYMNAVSSNYPNATAEGSNGGWFGDYFRVDFGNRASADAAYYKAASNADELNKIFQDISQEINTGSGSATHIQDGYEPGKSGYITFTDKLGQYMQLDATRGMTVVFGDQQYQCKDHTTSPDKTTDTYTFASTHVGGNGVYPEGDLKDLLITVTHGDLATGDVVTVKVPATLIPYRQFSVNQNEGEAPTMDVTEAYPIRVFYGVQPKAGVLDAVSTGVAPKGMSAEDFKTLQAYVAGHRCDDPQKGCRAYFLSNAWDANAADSSVGTTTSEFSPSASNSFYYFTENTPIFTDEAMQNHATRRDLADATGRTFYYAKTYYTKDAATGAVTDHTDPVAFPGRSLAILQGNVSYDGSGNAYVKAGTARLTRVQDYNENKVANETGTATKLLNPNWVDYSGTVDQNSIRAELGNNGKLSVDVPGELTVTKTVTAAAGLKAPDAEFPFTLKLEGAPKTDATYTGRIFDANGTQQGEDLPFTATGGDFTLKAGQTLHVYGLSHGMRYQVTEGTLPAGFTQDGVSGDNGTIASCEPSAATFTNTYKATPATLTGATFLKGAKVLKGRSWLDTDAFSFRLVGTKDAPMPAGATEGTQPGTHYSDVTVSNHGGTAAETPVGFAFGDIEFTAPGTYIYIIAENSPATGEEIPGMAYSQARYRVTVKVTDNGAGALTIPTGDVTMERFQDDDGADHLDKPESIADGTAMFTNTYSAKDLPWSPTGYKVYTDHSGAKPLTAGMFHFQVSATGDNAKDAPLPEDTILTNGEGNSILFNQATFTSQNVGQTYHYQVVEVVQQGGKWVPVKDVIMPSADGSYTLNGMTYDADVHTFSVAVTANEKGEIVVTPTYSDPQGKSGPGVYFTNSYRPTPVTLTGDTTIRGTKTITGRDMKEGEKFDFTLAGADEATTKAMTDGTITVGDKSDATYTASVSGAKKGEATGFDFGDVTFAKPGTYTFHVSETAPEDGNGMTYDRHIATVTVKVEDANGTLKVASGYPTYDNGEGKATDNAAFENGYKSSIDYGKLGGGVTVSKTLNGRDMKAKEFMFTIAGVDSGTASAGDANDKLTDDDRNFANDENRADGTAIDMKKLTEVTFTQDDAGKTFAYEIRETKGERQDIRYDASVYRLEIAVSDNGDGTMTATSTLTKTAGPDGKKLNPAESTGKATTTKDGTTFDSGTMTAAFTNDYLAVSSLPLTGGRGTAALVTGIGCGVLLLAGAAWWMARRRRA